MHSISRFLLLAVSLPVLLLPSTPTQADPRPPQTRSTPAEPGAPPNPANGTFPSEGSPVVERSPDLGAMKGAELPGLLPDSETLRAHLRLYARLQAEGQRTRAKQEYDRMQEILLDRGFAESPLLSGFFLQEAKTNLMRGNEREALVSAERAAAIGPHLLDAQWFLLRMGIQSTPMSLKAAPGGEALSASLSGIRVALLGFSNQHFLALNGYLLLISLLCMLPLLYLLAQYLRRLPHVHHGILELLPRSIPLWCKASAVWALLVSPLLWGLGSPFLYFFLLAVLWGFFSRAERLFSALLFVPTLILPFLSKATAPLFAPLDPEQPIYRILEAQDRGGEVDVIPGLREAWRKNPQDRDLVFVLAEIEKKGNHLEEAREHYEVLAGTEGSDPLVYNNLGNVYFGLGRYSDALSAHHRAAEIDSHLAAPHYNAAQTLLRQLEFYQARQELNRAYALDPELALSSPVEAGANLNRTTVDLDLPAARLWRKLASSSTSPSDPGALIRTTTGLVLVVHPLWSLVLSLYLLFLFLFRRKRVSGLTCTACGKPFCLRCRPTTILDLCSACDSRMEATSVPELQKKVLAQIQERSRNRERVRLLLLTLLLPGSGHLRMRAPWRGFFLLSLAGLLFLGWRLGGTAIVEPFPSLGTLLSGPARMALLGVATFFLYLGAWVSVLRLRRKQE